MILFLFNLLLLTMYGLISFAIFMVAQLISFRILSFNLYKWILKKMQMDF